MRRLSRLTGPIQCPGCRVAMQQDTLEGHYGATVTVDLCHACAALWFDGLESLALTPGAILRLFAIIHDNRPNRRNQLGDTLACPRCRQALMWTTDMQRGTRFHYRRCPHEHGRFITFFEFLREKNFVRPVSRSELRRLRQSIKMINCSNCGAPVDVGRGSACGYCRAPVSVLDDKQVETVVRELRQAEERRQTVDPTLPAQLMLDRMRVERAFAHHGAGRTGSELGDSFGLVEAGLASLVRLLRGER